MNIIVFLRQFKIGPFALFDLALSYAAIYLLAPLLSYGMSKLHVQVPKISWLLLTLPIGIAVHIVFRQNTPLNQMFFDPTQYLWVKLSLAAMVVGAILPMKIIK